MVVFSQISAKTPATIKTIVFYREIGHIVDRWNGDTPLSQPMYIISCLGALGQRLYAKRIEHIHKSVVLSAFGTENPLEAAMFFDAESAMKHAKRATHLRDAKVHQIVATVFAAREVE